MYSQIKDVTNEMTKYDYSCDKDLILKKKKKKNKSYASKNLYF